MNTVKNVEKAGRQFWLAGLGACIAGKEFAVEKMDQVFEATNSLVNEMMNKGSTIEGELKGKFQTNLAQDERIAEIRQKLGLNKEPRQDKIARLTAKVDALTDVVAKLTVKAEVESQAAKAEAEKATAKAPVAAKTAATPKKETVAKETATPTTTKSTATRKPRATAAKSGNAAAKTTTAKSTTAAKPATRRTRKPAQTTQSKTDTE